jgi:predicted nucleotidyltransferase
MTIDLNPEQLALVKAILTKHLADNAKIYVFGSRARGNARKFSDLDLAIDYQGKEVPAPIHAELAYDFEDSDLPFKVDIVDLNSISDNFKKNIGNDLTLLLLS